MSKDKAEYAEFRDQIKQELISRYFCFTSSGSKGQSVVYNIATGLYVGANYTQRYVWIYAYALKSRPDLAEALANASDGTRLPSGYICKVNPDSNRDLFYTQNTIAGTFGVDISVETIANDIECYAVMAENAAQECGEDTSRIRNDNASDVEEFDGNNQGFYDIDMSATEGTSRLVTHIERERNTTLAQNFKNSLTELRCEVCDFHFEEKYGDLGRGFIEAHHVNPIGQRARGEPTSITHFRALCSNCHNLIHRRWPALSVEELAARIKRTRNKGLSG